MTAVVTPQRLAILDKAVAAGGPLVLPTMHLYTNNVIPGPGTVLGDLTEATFGGYTAAAGLVWSAAFVGPDGTPQVVVPSQVFIADGTGPVETVYGWFLTNAAGTTLMAAGTLPAPAPMTAEDTGVEVAAVVRYGD